MSEVFTVSNGDELVIPIGHRESVARQVGLGDAARFEWVLATDLRIGDIVRMEYPSGPRSCRVLEAVPDNMERQVRLRLLPMLSPTTSLPPRGTQPTVTDAELANRYMHHTPKADQADRYVAVRLAVFECAKVIRNLTPVSAEQMRAFNALDEAMFLANAAIARNE